MGRRKGQEPLTRERILAAALQLIDREGLEALSMRKLGSTLGVDAMAVYHHVPGKEALLHAVVEQVFAGMPVPETHGTWQQQLRQWAHAYRGIALAHPNLVLRIVSDPQAVAVAAAHVNESLYAALEAADLPASTVLRAADVIVDHVHGYVLAAASGAPQDPAAAAAMATELAAQPASTVATQRRLLSDPDLAQGRDSFEFALDVILAGLAGLPRKPTEADDPADARTAPG